MKKKSQEDCSTKKIRKGDTVSVRTGNSKGKHGVVLSVNKNYVLVQGANLCKKHVKKSEAFPEGGIVSREAPIHISNVRVCNENGTPLKLKVIPTEDGERALYSLEGSEMVEYRKMKTPKV